MAGVEPSPPPPPRRRSIPLRRILATAAAISYYGGVRHPSVVLALSSPPYPPRDIVPSSAARKPHSANPSPIADVDDGEGIGGREDGTKKRTARIAVVGAGAVGSYYGGRLWEGAAAASVPCDDDDDDRVAATTTTSVLFHLRGENYDYCTKHGIEISSYHGDFNIPPHELLAYRTTEEMARDIVDASGTPGDDIDDEYFDWIVCALKSTAVSNYFFPTSMTTS
jgi:hypothetical protein